MAASAGTKENRFRSKAAEPVTNQVEPDYSRMVDAISRVFVRRFGGRLCPFKNAMKSIRRKLGGRNAAGEILDGRHVNV
jgi:hypothetical protein